MFRPLRCFTSVQASVVRNYLTKTRSKSVHSFGLNFVNWQTDLDTHTHTQTNCNENITPPRFRGGVKRWDNFEAEHNIPSQRFRWGVRKLTLYHKYNFHDKSSNNTFTFFIILKNKLLLWLWFSIDIAFMLHETHLLLLNRRQLENPGRLIIDFLHRFRLVHTSSEPLESFDLVYTIRIFKHETSVGTFI